MWAGPGQEMLGLPLRIQAPAVEALRGDQGGGGNAESADLPLESGRAGISSVSC